MKYYHLIAGLPDIKIEDNKLTYSIADFREEVRPILSGFDVRVMDLFFMKFDNQNLLNFLKDKEESRFDERGNITRSEMEECFRLVSTGKKLKNKYFLSYMKAFVVEYLIAQGIDDPYAKKPRERKKKPWEEDEENTPQVDEGNTPEKDENTQQEEEKNVSQVDNNETPQVDENDTAKWENRLAELYYKWAMECGNKLVSDWFEFNLNINNILAVCAGRKYKMNVEVLGNNTVAEAVKTSKLRDFGLTEIFEDIDLFLRLADEPDMFEREKKIDLMKWQWLDDQTFTKYFSIEIIFAYLIKLEIIERWVSFDPIEGGKLFRCLINDLKENVVNSPELINLKKNEL